MHEPDDWAALHANITQTFSPGAPIEERDLFAGRLDQLRALIDAVLQRGRHAIVFGERGVGKTSLANILAFFFSDPTRVVAPRVNATRDDTFTSLWLKVFKRLTFENGRTGENRNIADDYPNGLTPDDIQLQLSSFRPDQTPIIILDEFDRIEDCRTSTLVADTIKALSDYSINATVVIVGVAEDVSTLIHEHESISRSMVQVRMPRMTQDELGQIIDKRYRVNGMQVSDEALWKMTFLARGLPYYAHLLGMHAARRAIDINKKLVEVSEVDAALEVAIEEIDQLIKQRYQDAVISQRPNETLYEPVLLACALAPTDPLGRFQQTAVTAPLAKILPEKSYRPSTFAFHMNKFCELQRGRILERLGSTRNYRYRFREAVMQPFVILKGLKDGRINDEIAETFAHRRQLRLSADF